MIDFLIAFGWIVLGGVLFAMVVVVVWLCWVVSKVFKDEEQI